MAFLIIPVFAFLILCIIGACKENKLTGTYKALNIFGRIKAYLALDFTLCGLALTILSIIGLINPNLALSETGESKTSTLILILVGVVLCTLGVLLYISALKKSPPDLRKRVIFDMVLVGLGISLKITVFFISAVWELVKPEIYTDANGNSYYIYNDGSVYDSANNRYGTIDTDSNGNRCVKFITVR